MVDISTSFLVHERIYLRAGLEGGGPINLKLHILICVRSFDDNVFFNFEIHLRVFKRFQIHSFSGKYVRLLFFLYEKITI